MLSYWGLNKPASILQTILSNTLIECKLLYFDLKKYVPDIPNRNNLVLFQVMACCCKLMLIKIPDTKWYQSLGHSESICFIKIFCHIFNTMHVIDCLMSGFWQAISFKCHTFDIKLSQKSIFCFDKTSLIYSNIKGVLTSTNFMNHNITLDIILDCS